MKRVLLDTHVLLWWLAEPQRLSQVQYDYISSPESQVLVSAASIWEMRIKESLGKLEIPADIVSLIKDDGFDFLAVSELHADYLVRLPAIHKDPFDRLLIAQSLMEALPILSVDSVFQKYGLEVIT